MSFQITEAFHREYEDAFRMLYQQTRHELEGTVTTKTQTAEKQAFNFIGPTSVQWDLPRHSTTPLISTPHYRRWCTLHAAEWGEMIDQLDEVIMLNSPQSAYLQAAVAAMQRAKDERIIEAFGAAVITGKDGNTTVNSYDVGECRLINGDGTLVTEGSNFSDTLETPLTITKLALIGKLMDDANIPSTDRHIVANPYNKWALLQTTEVKSYDYNTVKALANGEIDTFMNFKFHWLPTERFTTNSTDTGCIECAAWHKDAMLMTTAQDIVTRVSEDVSHRWSVVPYAKMMIGAVRLQGKGVVRILLDKE